MGLEIHCQLTGAKSKLFCRCACDYRGKAPNANTCPTCAGLPGTLPLLLLLVAIPLPGIGRARGGDDSRIPAARLPGPVTPRPNGQGRRGNGRILPAGRSSPGDIRTNQGPGKG